MKIGIDLDNTITSSKGSIEFFRILTHLLIAEHEIYIITNREPGTKGEVAQELEGMGIQYSQTVISDKKAEFIQEQGVQIFFENEDEYFLELGEEVVVFKIREEGNFDFEKKKWIGSKKTVKII
ncbi:MAG: hypothetical protein ACYSSP_12030 [Planctomycetota bacterium]|jgi:hypothetical protein